MKLNKFLVILFLTKGLLAQYNTTAKIESVVESGLHKIIVPPEIRSMSKKDLEDFRIFDSKRIEIPYHILPTNNNKKISSFLEFKILSKTSIRDNKSSFVFEKNQSFINEIVLYLKSADIEKSYSISGSDNQKDWFGIVNLATLDGLYAVQETNIYKTISLPLTSYKFLKIEFNDRKTLPINILKIGTFTNKINNVNVEEIFVQKTKVVQILSQKKTKMYFSFDKRQIINRINFTVSSPNLFKRKAQIVINKLKVKHRKKTISPEIHTNFEFNSNSPNSINFTQIFEKDLIIEIENGDNQPLKIDKIQFLQNQTEIVADLKVDEKYYIQTGNAALSSPDYDLTNFKNIIESTGKRTKIYDVRPISTRIEKTKHESFWQKPWFMWLCISLGGMVISFFTINLVRDIKNNSAI